jgi:hypothetical protein
MTLDLTLVGWRARPLASLRSPRGSCRCAGEAPFSAATTTVGRLVNRIVRPFFRLMCIASFPQPVDLGTVIQPHGLLDERRHGPSVLTFILTDHAVPAAGAADSGCLNRESPPSVSVSEKRQESSCKRPRQQECRPSPMTAVSQAQPWTLQVRAKVMPSSTFAGID